MSTSSELRLLRPNDPFVVWVLGDLTPEHVLVDGDNVAFIGDAETDGEVWVTALGEDANACARLVVTMAASSMIDGVTVPEDAFALLPPELQSPDHGHWCFWVHDADLVPVGKTDAIELAADDPRIAPLLAHSDSAHIFPGDPRIVRWAGVVDGEELVSVAGQRLERTGAAHICSVCTAPDRRGQGLARRACTRIMQIAAVEASPAIVLEMYAANESGRRTYQALGFRETGRYRSGLLTGGSKPR
jgi:ribosomal protein S18 acetylase RimI-like enzyme